MSVGVTAGIGRALLVAAAAIITSTAIIAAACGGNDDAPTAPVAAERSDDQQEQHDDSSTTDAPSGSFTAVSTGAYHACGLSETGAIECWGNNEFGQADAPRGSFSAISAGSRHTCAIRESGAIECWGNNEFGQADAPRGSFTAVSTGAYHACGLSETGEIECWGAKGSTDDFQTEFDQLQLVDPPPGPFTAVSAEALYACGVRENGEIECWGDNLAGQTNVSQLRFGADRFVAVSTGTYHACGLSETGAIECWGNTGIQAGAGPSGSVYPFVAVSAGSFRTCAVRATQHFAPDGGPPTEGELVCWGEGEPLDPIYPDSPGSPAPLRITVIPFVLPPPAGSFTAVSISGSFGCGLTSTGAIECWGDKPFGVEHERRLQQFSAPPEMMLEQGANYRAIIELENGSIEIDLFEQAAPIHVNNFVFLVEQGFYDDLTFHRIVPEFVAQAGDPTATGTGSAGYTLPDEQVAAAAAAQLTLDVRGVISMARSGLGASSSQFFITLAPAGFLDEQDFTAFGRVTAGMELLDAFKERNPTAIPPEPPGPRIVSITIER